MDTEMKILKLQIDRPCFKAILNGEQKVEHRFVRPSNARRYVIEEDTKDENGDDVTNVTPVHYDALYLINGRRVDAPRLLVEILDSEFVILTDEDGHDLVEEFNGDEYYVCQVWYHLGKVLQTENVEKILDRTQQ